VTSDCDTTETSAIPNVVISDDGTSIVVELDDASPDEANDMPFLEPSSYYAFWTWESYAQFFSPCPSLTPPSGITASPIAVGDSSIASPSPSSVLAPTTSLAPTIDIIVVPPPSLASSSPPTDSANVAPAGSCTSDDQCTPVVRSRRPAEGASGVDLCGCYASSSASPFDECEGQGDANCTTARCMNTCEGYEARCDAGMCTLIPPPPTTAAPSILAPTSPSPTTLAPTSPSPTTDASPSSIATQSPSSIATQSPSSIVTQSPSSIASSSGSTVMPSTSAPTSAAPTIDVGSSSIATSSPSSSGSDGVIVAGTCTTDDECAAVVRSRLPENSAAGVDLCGCYASSSASPFDECEGQSDATCAVAKCTNACDGLLAYCDVSSSGDDGATGMCALANSTTGTTPMEPDGARDGPNSAYGARPFSLCLATTLLAAFMVAVFLQGNGDGGHPPRGYGKYALVAMAVSSVYSRASRGGGNTRRSYQATRPIPPQPNARILQTCSFNVEIMIDGCTKSVEIDAPAGRVVDAVITNQTSTLIANDGCSSTEELSANIAFPVTNTTQVFNLLDLEDGNNTAEAYPEFDYLCMRAVIGRPFVDATGGTLQAMPNVVGGDASWTGESLGLIHASRRNNSTSHDRYLLVEDWTQRALGEHSSVASFSAFSIALMSNQAPSDLVSDALTAGLDEVRHAKTSFEIASVLAGRDVRPGPLPPSSHKFHDDLRALAIAVAREGCVDETLSAFAAAFEVEHIIQVLDGEIHDSLYATVDCDSLAFIRDEQAKIALDESNHSALAWRTLGWVCTIDSAACDSAYKEVFDEDKLEMRFMQRAKSSMGEKDSALHFMRSEWKNIFHAHRLAHSDSDERGIKELSCTEKVMGAVDHSSPPLLASVVNNILRQLTR
jgi:hypothetical protein